MQRGKQLAASWGLDVKQPLYRRTGDWYHQLKRFPGALLDADGYLIFENEEAFKSCPQLRMGKDPQRNGGWVSAPDGVKAIPGYIRQPTGGTDAGRSLVESLIRSRKRSSGQAWGGTAEGRRAIESYAMLLAKQHFAGLWPEVMDVSATNPFDLLCRDSTRELHVEVKGTTSLGSSVLLTRNEVQHAHDHTGCVALFIVSNILVNGSRCAGGVIKIIEPWNISDDELEPIAFECRLHLCT